MSESLNLCRRNFEILRFGVISRIKNPLSDFSRVIYVYLKPSEARVGGWGRGSRVVDSEKLKCHRRSDGEDEGEAEGGVGGGISNFQFSTLATCSNRRGLELSKLKIVHL